MSAQVDEACVLTEGPWTHRFVGANGSRFHVVEAGTELSGPLGGTARVPGSGVTVETAPLGATGTELPCVTSASEHPDRQPRTTSVAVAVRENEIMTHLRE